jgi:2-polyprenyl-3-methyl-5-hydroxy-6-metoxy-1,4-benzoquinol methylase
MYSLGNQAKLIDLVKSRQDLINSNKATLRDIFSNENDDFWFWLLTDGKMADPTISQLLPGMPEERVQLNFTGRSGKDALSEAFSAYKLFKALSEKYGKRITNESSIMDFGCGWGRIIRFFLKDLDPSRLYGLDCYREMIDICKKQNLNCNFEAIDPMPPVKYQNETFDIIYLYSVFSHLSEDVHLAWLKEFCRILKPEGILIATTRPIEFIDYCRTLAQNSKVNEWERGSVIAFVDPEEAYKNYREGKFVHCPTGGGGVLDKSFFGETCISEKYVNTTWSSYFRNIAFLPSKIHQQFDQDVIIAVK